MSKRLKISKQQKRHPSHRLLVHWKESSKLLKKKGPYPVDHLHLANAWAKKIRSKSPMTKATPAQLRRKMLRNKERSQKKRKRLLPKPGKLRMLQRKMMVFWPVERNQRRQRSRKVHFHPLFMLRIPSQNQRKSRLLLSQYLQKLKRYSGSMTRTEMGSSTRLRPHYTLRNGRKST